MTINSMGQQKRQVQSIFVAIAEPLKVPAGTPEPYGQIEMTGLKPKIPAVADKEGSLP